MDWCVLTFRLPVQHSRHSATYILLHIYIYFNVFLSQFALFTTFKLKWVHALVSKRSCWNILNFVACDFQHRVMEIKINSFNIAIEKNNCFIEVKRNEWVIEWKRALEIERIKCSHVHFQSCIALTWNWIDFKFAHIFTEKRLYASCIVDFHPFWMVQTPPNCISLATILNTWQWHVIFLAETENQMPTMLPVSICCLVGSIVKIMGRRQMKCAKLTA